MSDPVFAHSQEHLQSLAADVLRHARDLGATDCGTEISESSGLSVSVRKRKVETIEQTRDKVVGVTCYIGQRRGHASTSDLSPKALRDTVAAAYDIARYTAEDPCAGLPDEDTVERSPRELDLYHPWLIGSDEAASLALRAEQAAFDVSPVISNSDGASVSVHHGHFVAANSRGFMGGYPYSRHFLSVAPIARKGRTMQRDDWYTSKRAASEMADPEAVGRYAAERALARLGGRKLSTMQVPVLFEAPVAAGLLGSFVQAVSGGALYRKASFLVDSLGTEIFAPHLHVREDPWVPRAMGSSPFDEEGCRSEPRDVVSAGVLQGYFLATYAARKLGMKSTGNAGGSHNLRLSSQLTQPDDDFRAMLRKLHRGLLVVEVMGQGVNYVTGDYSRGAFGYWVENGEITGPVEEITIAGNLRDMYRNIVAVGADEIIRGTKITGSILIDGMTIAGEGTA